MEATKRFSTRVADYVRYRPSYPPQLLALLTAAGALSKDAVVADIGSGTGLLTRLFLEHGNTVFGVEPNPEMRAAGEAQLRQFTRFISVAGTAEATTLPGGSVDLVVAGQAFHWFDGPRARQEFARIARDTQAWVALIWNERLVDATPFLQGYEQLLRQFSTDYTKVDHRQMTPEVIGAFFAPHTFQRWELPNRQVFDFEALRGRLLSSSYAPLPDDPRHAPMLATLQGLFDGHNTQGQVAFEYQTRIYLGVVS